MKSECVVYDDGTKRWFLNDVLHREDGPAVEYSDGGWHWFINGICHRLDGPAIKFADGAKIWSINGNIVCGRINRWAKENDIDLDNLTDEDIALIKLFWG